MQIVISLLGGLGLFLYGMNLMGESLEKVAGSKMKKIIENQLANNGSEGLAQLEKHLYGCSSWSCCNSSYTKF